MNPAVLNAINPAGPLAQTNLAILRAFFVEHADLEDSSFLQRHYAPSDSPVIKGATTLPMTSGLNYAHVPLGLILSGSLAVVKNGKATKQLRPGDFLGLFETADYLSTGKNRLIGEWTLEAAEETEVLYFSSAALATSAQLRDYLCELARQDAVPQPVTEMPLLDWVASHTTTSRLTDYAIVINTHLLPNYYPYFRHLAHLVGFNRLFILEKAYSTVPRTFHKLIQSGCDVVQVLVEPGRTYDYAARASLDLLWEKVIEEYHKTGFKNLLVISDGGDLWNSLPWESFPGVRVAGVEQTQRGIARVENSSRPHPPIIGVASSGIKKIVEAKIIARSVVTKLTELHLPQPDQRVGIIGLGSIGSALADQLKNVATYDPDQPSTSSSLDTLLNDCDLIIGTTGTDALRGIALERVNGHKILVSASSADVEFYSLLKLAPPTNAPFATRNFSVHDGLTVEILNGGYPINFDREKDACPDDEIALTYSLMYIAAMQGVQLISKDEQDSVIYDIDQTAQRNLLERWIAEQKSSGKDPAIDPKEFEHIIQYSASAGSRQGPPVWDI